MSEVTPNPEDATTEPGDAAMIDRVVTADEPSDVLAMEHVPEHGGRIPGKVEPMSPKDPSQETDFVSADENAALDAKSDESDSEPESGEPMTPATGGEVSGTFAIDSTLAVDEPSA